ncbi:LPXTG cell wall anchor domain-containing protein, partial [Lysinibacillus capsici]|uniref:LPXTG cell wall anchor domain-containing protein n=1 Tax=Lysinibacillus capsici TaxID=2115968 RepID=UPI0028B02184
PDPEKPEDPNNPDPENPVEPNKPNPDSNNSANSGKTEGSKPSVQGVIDQGKNLPPYNPTKATKDTLDAYKDFLNKYSQLTKEEQEAVADSLDINKIKSDAKRLEAQLKAQGKLPQTDGADQTALTLIGVALILGALFFLRRRNAEVK